MCAGSEAKIGGVDVIVYMGYYGGSITLGDTQGKYRYNDKGRVKVWEDENLVSREEMATRLLKFKKREIVEMILELIDNANE